MARSSLRRVGAVAAIVALAGSALTACGDKSEDKAQEAAPAQTTAAEQTQDTQAADAGSVDLTDYKKSLDDAQALIETEQQLLETMKGLGTIDQAKIDTLQQALDAYSQELEAAKAIDTTDAQAVADSVKKLTDAAVKVNEAAAALQSAQ